MNALHDEELFSVQSRFAPDKRDWAGWDNFAELTADTTRHPANGANERGDLGADLHGLFAYGEPSVLGFALFLTTIRPLIGWMILQSFWLFISEFLSVSSRRCSTVARYVTHAELLVVSGEVVAWRR
ncbi:hypothetical protein [Gemmata massiliana]|uniref:hypothetical protein n=1 Tax=Gemmata massiliana TaxID=1210884 RepID=UPI0013A6B935|nr:hypothetical protein [Gemmata massiliana]